MNTGASESFGAGRLDCCLEPWWDLWDLAAVALPREPLISDCPWNATIVGAGGGWVGACELRLP